MDVTTVLMIVFIVLMCVPIAYLAFYFVRQLNIQLARNLKQKQKMRKAKDEKRSVYYNGRPGRGR